MPGDKDARKVTVLVNNTEYPLDLYKVTANRTKYYRKTLNPFPQRDNVATISTNATTMETNISDLEEEPNMYREEYFANETYGTLRVYYGGKAVLHVDTDQMLDNAVIDIGYKDGSFTVNPQGRPARRSGSGAPLHGMSSPSKVAVGVADSVGGGSSSSMQSRALPAMATDNTALPTPANLNQVAANQTGSSSHGWTLKTLFSRSGRS